MGNTLRSLSCASGSVLGQVLTKSPLPAIGELAGDSYQENQSNRKTALTERQALEGVYKNIFQKFSEIHPSQPVTIPRREFDYWRCVIEQSIMKPSSKGGTAEDIKRLAGADKKKWLIADLLNTSNVTPAKTFTIELENELRKLTIKTKMLTSITEVSNLGTVLIIVCNKSDNEAAKQAVDKSLKDIEDSHYKRTIIIVLHVTRKLPRTSTKDELKVGDNCGKYLKIGSIIDMAFVSKEGIYECKTNENALREVQLFCSNFYATKFGEQKTEAETSMQPTCATSSESNTVGLPISYCKEVKEEFPSAYIIDPSGTPAAKKFVHAFQEIMRNSDIEISETPVSEADKLDPDAVVILVCNNTSRIETDIDKSLSAISAQRYGRTILIILHVASTGLTRSNSQRKTKPSSEKYTKYKNNCLGMIDMSFTPGKGIYESPMNTKAFEELRILYDRLTSEGKETDTKRELVEERSNQLMDQAQASNKAVPTKKSKNGIEQEAVKNPTEENLLEHFYP